MPRKGYKKSEEHKAKQRQSIIKFYEEHPEVREKLRQSRLGKKCTNEQKENQRQFMLGKKYALGCKRSDEFKENQRQRMLGENSPFWNPNLTDEERELNNRKPWRDEEYERWVANGKKSDNFICLVCGRKWYLHSHHLNSWADFPEERYSPANHATLCKSCHDAYHKDCGKGKNTEEEFEYWTMNYKSLYDL